MLRILIPILAFTAGLAFSALPQTVTNPAPCGIAGAYNASPQTITSGNFGLVQVDINGNIKIAP